MKRIILFFLGLTSVINLSAQQSDGTNTTQFNVIRNQTVPGGNTRTIVADAFEALNSSKVNRSETLVATGTNDYTITPPFTPDYSKNPQFLVKFQNGNTGPVTVNTIAIKKNVSTALSSGDIVTGGIYQIVYDGTNFQINISSGGGSGTVTSVTSADANATVANTTTTPVVTIVSAPKLATVRTIGIITGDGTSSGSSFDGSASNTNALTLATVNSNTGSFGSSTSIPTFTVNGKGLITAASGNAVIAPAGTLSGTTLNSTVVNSSITSVGTIGAGTWQATPVIDAYIASATTWNAKVTSVTITQPAAGITVTNSGSAQAPVATATISLANDLAGLEGLSSTGIPVRTGTDTWTQRTITGTSNQITVTNGDGVSGNPTLSLPSSLVLPNGTTATTQSANDNSTKPATTAYVDNAVLGQRTKEAAKYASTAALPSIVYSNGSSGVGATITGVALAAISLDGNSPSLNDRVLIKNQASTFQNGIYTVTQTGSGIAVFILTRATDFDQAADIQTGDNVFITSGNTLSTTTWTYNAGDNPVMGTDPITFVQIAGQGSFTAGNGITITGVSIAINTSVTVDKTTSQALTNKDLTSGTNTFPVFPDANISSAAAWNAKVSSQWTTTGSDIYYNTGNVMIGANAAPSSKFHVVETSTSTPRGILADQYSTGTSGSRITMRKARGTFASPTTIVTGDVLGSWTSSGYDGANFIESGKILSTSVGTIGTNIVPSKMEFQTANSSGTLTTGLTIDQSQNVTIAGTIGASNFSGTHSGTSSNTNSGDVTLAGENYLSISGQVITANAVNLSGTNVTGTLAAARFPALTGEATTSAGSLSVTLDNAAVIGKVLTGYTSGSGTISATDNILQAIQKLNGNDAGKWSLASGGTLTGVNTITSNANSQIIFGGTWTATGNSQYHVNIGGTLTSLTGNSTLYGTLINTTMTAGATGHTLSLLRLDAGNLSATNSPTRYALNALGSVLITTSAGTGASSLTVNNSTGSVSTNFDVQNTGTSVFKVSSSGSVTFAPSTATTAAAYTFAGNVQTATSGAQNIFTVSTSNKAGANNDVLSILNITSTMDVNSKTGVNMQGIYYNPTVTGSPNSHFAWQHTSGYVQWNSVLSPAQITSNQNDYNPTGLNTGGAPNGASILRVTTDASRNLTSVVGGATGRLLIIANVGSFDLVIKNDDGSTGTAANRFALNADITLSAGKSLMFWYDGTSSRWRVNSL